MIPFDTKAGAYHAGGTPRCHINVMTTQPVKPSYAAPPGGACGYLSNGGVCRYLLDVESTTGYMAWEIAGGPLLISNSQQVSLPLAPSVTFWSCSSYSDSTPTGRVRSFDCHGNQLTHLDVRTLTGLEFLDCSFNLLRRLEVAGLTLLQVLDADNNLLEQLQLRTLTSLRVLNCASNRLTVLDLQDMATLQVLDCSDNPLEPLDLAGCTSLKDVKTGLPGTTP